MSKIALVSDTTADLPPALLEKMNLRLADAYVHFGNRSYVVSDLAPEEFHEKLEQADKEHFPKTSQPTAADILEIYEDLKHQGYDKILSIHVSSKLSGTINSANVAKGMIDEIDIRIVDSNGVSITLVACLEKAHNMIQTGVDIDKIEKEIIAYGKQLKAHFALETMENLVRGGRMSPIRHFFGRLLDIKPVLELSNGEITPYKKVRGIENARKLVFDIATDKYTSQSKFKYIIAHTREKELAVEMEEKLLRQYPNAHGYIIEIGIVVATHAGKGAFLLFTY